MPLAIQICLLLSVNLLMCTLLEVFVTISIYLMPGLADNQCCTQAVRAPPKAAAAPSLLEFDDSEAAPVQPAAPAATASMQGRDCSLHTSYMCM